MRTLRIFPKTRRPVSNNPEGLIPRQAVSRIDDHSLFRDRDNQDVDSAVGWNLRQFRKVGAIMLCMMSLPGTTPIILAALSTDSEFAPGRQLQQSRHPTGKMFTTKGVKSAKGLDAECKFHCLFGDSIEIFPITPRRRFTQVR
jgi:hypothetical protein